MQHQHAGMAVGVDIQRVGADGIGELQARALVRLA
jgi:hypothetical protein